MTVKCQVNGRIDDQDEEIGGQERETIKAVGNDTDSGLEDKELDGCVNFDTGIVDIQSALDSSTAVSCSDS